MGFSSYVNQVHLEFLICCCCFTVLEAGDLASLLAQFEASEAVNTPGSDNPGPDSVVAGGTQKQLQGAVATESQQTPTTAPQHKASPTHQNIKDALPKEIIEKIKGRSSFGEYFIYMSKCEFLIIQSTTLGMKEVAGRKKAGKTA